MIGGEYEHREKYSWPTKNFENNIQRSHNVCYKYFVLVIWLAFFFLKRQKF